MTTRQLHYLVLTCGSTGDVYPFISIAQTLQAQGRKVTFIGNCVHANKVMESGLKFVGYGTEADYQRIINNPDIWHPRRAIAILFADSKNQMVEVNSIIKAQISQDSAPRETTIIIAHPLAVGSAAIAREQGLVDKIVTMQLAPISLRTCCDPMRVGGFIIPKWVPISWRKTIWRMVEFGWVRPVVLKQTNLARRDLGLGEIKSYLDHLAVAQDLTVTLFAPWFGPNMPDWPQPLINADFQLFDSAPHTHFAPELVQFLAAGEAPIIFTPGTANVHAGKFFACALQAVQSLGKRAIFLTKERAQVPAQLPASVLWQPYVALANLLPKAQAVVHHGGIGTTAEALRAATPQLITPFAWDQFDNAARIKDLGVGLVLNANSINVAKLSDVLRQLIIAEHIKQRCGEIANRFNNKLDVVQLCQQIEARLLVNDIGE